MLIIQMRWVVLVRRFQIFKCTRAWGVRTSRWADQSECAGSTWSSLFKHNDMCFYGPSVWNMNHDLHNVGWFTVYRSLLCNPMHSFLCPVGWMYFAWLSPCSLSSYHTGFGLVASVRVCLTLLSNSCEHSLLFLAWLDNATHKMISQVNPTPTVSSFLPEGLSLVVTIGTTVVLVAHADNRGPYTSVFSIGQSQASNSLWVPSGADIKFFFLLTDRQTEIFSSVCLSVKKSKKISGQTDEKMSVCLSVKKKKFYWTDRRTKKCPSVCPSNKKKEFWTDRRMKKCPSVCPSKKRKIYGQTYGRKNVRLSVRQTKKKNSGQTDGRKNVRLSVRQKKIKKFRTDIRTEKISSVCPSTCYATVLLRHGLVMARPCYGTVLLRHGLVTARSCYGTVLLRHDLVTSRSCYVTVLLRHGKNVRLSVQKFFRPSVCPEFFFFFLTDRQMDEKMSVCLSGIFFFFFWRTDRRTKKRKD